MPTWARTLVVGLVLCTGAVSAGAAGPVLELGTQCPTSAASPGGTATVTIALTPGTTPAGAAAAISGLDFTLRYDPGSLVFQRIALAEALDALEGWASPAVSPFATPGTLQVLLPPLVRLPLPVFPAGPVAVATFGVSAGAADGCVPVTFVPGSVVFSAPPLGEAVPGGSAIDGGVQVTHTSTTTTTVLPTTTTTVPPPVEVCDDCEDNDRDELVDLADPECGATGLAVIKATVRPGKPGTAADDRVIVQANLPVSIGDLGSGVHLALAGAASPIVCETVAASNFHSNRKRTVFTYRHGGPGLVLVRLVQRKGRTQVSVTVKGRQFTGAGLTLTLAVGEGRYRGSATLRTQKKKLVYP